MLWSIHLDEIDQVLFVTYLEKDTTYYRQTIEVVFPGYNAFQKQPQSQSQSQSQSQPKAKAESTNSKQSDNKEDETDKSAEEKEKEKETDKEMVEKPSNPSQSEKSQSNNDNGNNDQQTGSNDKAEEKKDMVVHETSSSQTESLSQPSKVDTSDVVVENTAGKKEMTETSNQSDQTMIDKSPSNSNSNPNANVQDDTQQTTSRFKSMTYHGSLFRNYLHGVKICSRL